MVTKKRRALELEAHHSEHEPGGADALTKSPEVKRDLSGNVIFKSFGTGSTSTTATGTYVTTTVTYTGTINYTQAVISVDGAATTVTYKLFRNGNTLTKVAGVTTPTTMTVSSMTNLTGTNTWTASVMMAAGTTVTGNINIKKADTLTQPVG